MYGWIFFGVIVVILGFNVLGAVIRGFSKSLFRLISVLAAAVVAVALCLIGKSLLPDGVTLVEMINSNMGVIQENLGADVAETVAEILEYLKISPVLTETIIQLTGALAAPILCFTLFTVLCVVFGIFYLIALIVRRIVIAVRHGKKWKPMRGWSALLGLAQGLVVATVLLIPISGYLNLAQPAMDTMIQQDILDEDDVVVQTVQDVVVGVNESFTMKAYRVLGGNLMTESLMSVKVGDVKVSLQDETKTLVKLVDGVVQLAAVDTAAYGPDEAAVMRSLGDAFVESKLLTPIMGDVLYGATDAWMQGEDFYGVSKPTAGEEMGMILDPTLDVLVEILHDDAQTADTLRGDVLTLAELAAILVENRVLGQLGDTDGLLNALNNEPMVVDMVTTLSENQSMKRLIPEVTNLGIRALGYFLNIPQDTQEVYEDFLVEVADSLNNADLSDPEQIKELSNKVSNAFDSVGVYVNDEIIDLYMTGMIHDLVDNHAMGSEVTPADVQAFFMIYAQTLQEAQNEQDDEASANRPVFDLLVSSDNLDAFFAVTAYSGMSEEERRNTAAATLAYLCMQIMEVDKEAEDYSEQVFVMAVVTYTNLLGDNHVALDVVKDIQITKPVTGDEVQNPASLGAYEDMKEVTVVITMEALLVDSKAAAENITPDNVAAEAAVITTIFSAAGDMAGLTGGGSADLDMQTLAGSVGTILDSLNEANSFGSEKTANLFTAILQSETVREAAGMDMTTATQMAGQVTQGGGNYGETIDAVAGSLTLIEKIQNSEAVTDAELLDFLKKLTPETAGMFKVYISASRLIDYGVPKSQSDISAELLGSIFTYMAEDGTKNYEFEAQTLNKLLQMGLDARDSDNEKLFTSEDGTVTGKLPTARETVTTALDSAAIRHALLDVLTDGNKVTRQDPMNLSSVLKTGSSDYTATVDAVRGYRAEHNEMDDLVFEAAFALFGIEETID